MQSAKTLPCLPYLPQRVNLRFNLPTQLLADGSCTRKDVGAGFDCNHDAAAASAVLGGRAEGDYSCPVTGKVFTAHSHIVALKTTGNVYSYDAVDELCIKPKNWKVGRLFLVVVGVEVAGLGGLGASSERS